MVLANLSGFDGSPESLRNVQLEYGAEIGRAIVNFDGPIVFCVISRYHGGAFVVFSGVLNDNMEVLAVEGSYASVLGGAPAAAVVFTGEVNKRTAGDPRVRELEAALSAADGVDEAHLRVELAALRSSVRSEKLGEVAAQFEGDPQHRAGPRRRLGARHRPGRRAAPPPHRRRGTGHGPRREILTRPFRPLPRRTNHSCSAPRPAPRSPSARQHSVGDLLHRTAARVPGQARRRRRRPAVHVRGVRRRGQPRRRTPWPTAGWPRATGWRCSATTRGSSPSSPSPPRKLGVVLVPVNFMLGADEIAFILGHSGATGMVAEDALATTAEKALATAGVRRAASAAGSASPAPPPRPAGRTSTTGGGRATRARRTSRSPTTTRCG